MSTAPCYAPRGEERHFFKSSNPETLPSLQYGDFLSLPSTSRSGLQGFWMRRTPCGPSAARPSPQLDTLLQATFLDMFGDPVTNPKGWEVRSLRGLAEVKPNDGVLPLSEPISELYYESVDSGCARDSSA